MKVNSTGFTLIELMIVIAIIGIIAAIALPNYMNYVGRAQAVEGFKLTSGLQNEIDIWHHENQSFPDSTVVASTGYIGTLAQKLEGKYVQNNAITVTANNGVINVPFDAGANAGSILRMQPVVSSDKVIVWTCTGNIDSSRIPSSCQ